MVEDTFFYNKSLVKTKEHETYTAHSERSNDLSRVPSVCASTPCQANDERGERARHGEDANVVNA